MVKLSSREPASRKQARRVALEREGLTTPAPACLGIQLLDDPSPLVAAPVREGQEDSCVDEPPSFPLSVGGWPGAATFYPPWEVESRGTILRGNVHR